MNEATVNDIIPLIQSRWFRYNARGKTSYNELADDQKRDLAMGMRLSTEMVERELKNITENREYLSWMYSMLKQTLAADPESPLIAQLGRFDRMKVMFKTYDRIKNSAKFLKFGHKDIKAYKTIESFVESIDSFIKNVPEYSHLDSLNKSVYEREGLKIYSLREYDAACEVIRDVAWCIKDRSNWNMYRPPFFMFVRNGRKEALAHFDPMGNSALSELKDVHDKPYRDIDANMAGAIDWLIEKYNDEYGYGNLGMDFLWFLRHKYTLGKQDAHMTMILDEKLVSILTDTPELWDMAGRLSLILAGYLAGNNVEKDLKSFEDELWAFANSSSHPGMGVILDMLEKTDEKFPI
jgi:hypothetical protein